MKNTHFLSGPTKARYFTGCSLVLFYVLQESPKLFSSQMLPKNKSIAVQNKLFLAARLFFLASGR
jgi:hypothetical protein